MTEIFVSGTFDWFENSSIETDPLLNYILCPVSDTDQPTVQFRNGTVVAYDTSPVHLLASGTWDCFARGTVLVVTSPFGAFNDFTIYNHHSGPDPVNGVVLATTSLSTGGVGAAWTRHYNVLIPPKTARFVVPHIKLGSVAAGNSQYLDGHQFEVLRTNQTAPTSFDSARSIQVYVRPTRLNLSGNPKGQVSTVDWSGVTTTVGGFNCSSGVASHTVDEITPGQYYTASAEVTFPGQNPVTVACTFLAASTTVTLTFESTTDNQIFLFVTGGIETAFGVIDGGTPGSPGPGSLDGGTVLTPGTGISDGGSPTAGGTAYFVTDMLVEAGIVVRPYFDGNSGDDYLWEQDGTPGATRSYYYPDRSERHYVLVRNLEANAPIGTTVETPVYATLPAPSSSS